MRQRSRPMSARETEGGSGGSSSSPAPTSERQKLRTPEEDELGVQEVPRVLVVVVTHNGRRWLRACLESIGNQDYPDIDVVVVDNGSDNSIAPLVAESLAGAEVLRVERNVGFAAGANLALESSRNARNAKYFLFMHDDVVLHPDCVRRLVRAAEETDAGVVGGKGLSWEDPDILLEVGMTADQFCYPFSGLEEGEIDQGQHDQRREVLFVTSACCLLSRALIERCGSWDGGYFMFGEDLDLCIRSRMAGFRVLVEPPARFHHAVAAASSLRDLRKTEHTIRFFTRRNRLRTIVKTAATYRMWIVALMYLFLGVGEVIVLAGLRRFEEIPAYPRAFGSFFVSIPDVIRRRRAVQKRRALPDRRIRRLMVRDLHRIRIFAERRVRDWEVGTLRFGAQTLSRLSPSRIKQSLGLWVRRPSSLVGIALAVFLAIAMRGMVGGTPLAAGTIWPFPDEGRRLIGDFLAGWRDVGLGSPSSPPAALPLLWLVSLASFARPRFAQNLLIVGPLVIGLIGMYRLTAPRALPGWPRLFAMGVYALGPATQLMVGSADMGALAVYAAAPYLLEIGLKMLGPTPGAETDRPAIPLTTDQMTQSTMRLALVTALMAALAPSGLVAVVLLWVIVGLLSFMHAWDRREGTRRIGWILASAGVALILLAPWTIDALRSQGSILGPLFSGGGGGPAYGALWAGRSFVDFLTLGGRSPIPAAWVAPAIGLGALLLTSPTRRRESRLLVLVWLLFSFTGGLVANDHIPAPVASPAIWMAIPLACVAALAGHLVAGVREELHRHVLGWRHILTLLVSLALTIGIGLGWVPELRGWGRPESSVAGGGGAAGKSVSSFLTSSADQVGEFRVMWLGARWVDPVRGGVRPLPRTSYLITGAEGLSILDLYEPSPREGERRLDETVNALIDRRLHHAGHLLAPSGIRYVIVGLDDSDLLEAMQRQRDFQIALQQGGIAVFHNLTWVARASLAPPGLAGAAQSTDDEERTLMLSSWTGGRDVPRLSQTAFQIELPKTFHPVLLLGDNFDPGWRARIGEQELKHDRSFGWANNFLIPQDAEGVLHLEYTRRWIRRLLAVAQLMILALAIAMARIRSVEISGRLR